MTVARDILVATGGGTFALGNMPANSLLVTSGDEIVGLSPGATAGNTLSNSSGTWQDSAREWNIGENAVVGMALQNDTAAVSGAGGGQWGPILALGAQGYASTPTESQSVRWGLQCRSTAGTGAPGGQLYHLRSTNLGAWTNSGLPYYKSDGLSYIPNLVCTTGVMGATVQCNGAPSGTVGRFKLSNTTPASPGSTSGSMPNIPDAASGTYVWVVFETSDGNRTWCLGVQ